MARTRRIRRMPRTRRIRSKQKGGVLTYEQEQYLLKKEANRKALAALRQANALKNNIVGMTPRTPAQIYRNISAIIKESQQTR